MVEVSAGEIDYTNPDALVARYRGEFQTYNDPREAIETAIAICKAWRREGEKRARIGIGATGGMTMPFDTCSFQAARAWAKREYATLPKCDRCRGLLSDEYYYDPDDHDCKFCSELCAEVSISVKNR